MERIIVAPECEQRASDWGNFKIVIVHVGSVLGNAKLSTLLVPFLVEIHEHRDLLRTLVIVDVAIIRRHVTADRHLGWIWF